MSDGFQRVLDHIRSIAGTEVEKGCLFERLMKTYFQQDPLYRDRFADVRLWSMPNLTVVACANTPIQPQPCPAFSLLIRRCASCES